MRTNSDLTIYNRVPKTEDYLRTALAGASGRKAAQWENRKAINVLRSGGASNADQAVIYIPFSLKATYKTPKQWQALSAEEKSEYWTLQNGDLIVKGVVDDVIEAGFTASQLKAKYDDVLVISSIDTMDFGSAALQHFKVSAK